MALSFRPAMPSERDEVERAIRAAFTPYVRALGRELSDAGFVRLPAELECGDIYVGLDADRLEHLVRLYRCHGFEIVRRGPPGHGLDPHTRVYMVKSFR